MLFVNFCTLFLFSSVNLFIFFFPKNLSRLCGLCDFIADAFLFLFSGVNLFVSILHAVCMDFSAAFSISMCAFSIVSIVRYACVPPSGLWAFFLLSSCMRIRKGWSGHLRLSTCLNFTMSSSKALLSAPSS